MMAPEHAIGTSKKSHACDNLGPVVAALDAGNTTGGENAQNLFARNLIALLGHDEIDEVVDVRQVFAVVLADRYVAVESERLNMLSRFVDIFLALVQAVNHVAVIGPQRGRELAVAAADVNDKSPFCAADAQDLLGG